MANTYSVEFDEFGDGTVTLRRWVDDPKFRGGQVLAEEVKASAKRVFELMVDDH